jgi:hypothetical protein
LPFLPVSGFLGVHVVFSRQVEELFFFFLKIVRACFSARTCNVDLNQVTSQKFTSNVSSPTTKTRTTYSINPNRGCKGGFVMAIQAPLIYMRPTFSSVLSHSLSIKLLTHFDPSFSLQRIPRLFRAIVVLPVYVKMGRIYLLD